MRASHCAHGAQELKQLRKMIGVGEVGARTKDFGRVDGDGDAILHARV